MDVADEESITRNSDYSSRFAALCTHYWPDTEHSSSSKG